MWALSLVIEIIRIVCIDNTDRMLSLYRASSWEYLLKVLNMLKKAFDDDTMSQLS